MHVQQPKSSGTTKMLWEQPKTLGTTKKPQEATNVSM